MSNLSELLPTGGGQNAVDFVASGTLSSGQTVALKADGTVEAVSGVTEGAGTPVVFEAAATQYTATVYDSNENKIVIAYQDNGNSNAGTAVVGTVSGTSISFGTPVVFNSGGVNRSVSAAFDSTTNKVVIAYQDTGNSQYGTVIVGTVSGTSVSFGSAVVFESAETDYISVAIDNSSKVVIGFQDAGNFNYAKVRVGIISGTAVGSFGSTVTIGSSGDSFISCVYESNADKIVVSYRDGATGFGTSRVGTISGTSISFGSAVVFESASSSFIVNVFNSTENKIVIFYRDGGNSSYGTAVVGTVSGTSISFGSAVVFNSANSYYTSATYDLSANKTVTAFTDGGNSTYGTVVVGTVSGTSISFGSLIVFENAAIQYSSCSFDSSSNKVIIAYTDQGNLSYGTSVVFQNGSSNYESFIGITAEAISDTATGAVNVYGGINEAQTGLTIGSDYYIDITGAISTSPPLFGKKLGKAISATTLNLLDYPSIALAPGQQAFTTAGTYSWVAPAGVTSVSVVAVGAGNVYGSGGSPKSGGGGGLGWKNNISVNPGTSYTVFVGAANSASTSADGEDSYFIDTSTVKGGGAFFNSGTSSNSGGTYVGDGGGNGGGTGGNTVAGGGAGGYSGNGGNGASNYGSGSAGSGGGAGGGGQGVAYDRVQGATGGGVGIFGEGSSGAGGTGNTVQPPTGGGGGSGGGNGDWGSGPGGTYGGGGAIDWDASLIQRVRPGADGAVRIIWGAGRAFPSTNTGDL